MNVFILQPVKVMVDIRSLIPCSSCEHVNSPRQRGHAFLQSLEEFYCQKEFESLLKLLPQTHYQGQMA